MKHIAQFTLALFLLFSVIQKGDAQTTNFGVNLAGLDFGPTILPGVAGANYFVPTAAELDYYKSKGLSLIRLPFLWERAQPILGGNLDPTYMGYIDGIIAAASSRNMSIILDMHNYGRYPQQGGNVIGSTGGPTLANFQDVWTKLALRYTNEPAVWGFDLMNEPHDLGNSITWYAIAQAGITAIRTADQTHVILVEGDNWSKGNTWAQYNSNLKNLTDPNNNLVFEAHQYFDHDQSGQYLASKNNNTVAGAGADANTGVAYITPFVDWLNANNLKGIVGEYGVPNTSGPNSDLANWNTLLTNFMDYIQQNCVGGTYWAGGPAWGNYITSIEPTKSGSTYIDAPQMAILTNYSSLPSGCSLSSNAITVSVTAPTDQSVQAEGSSITLSADAIVTETGTTITEVKFYANGTLIGTSTSSPYSVVWDNVSAGTYVVKATATSNTMQTASSLGKTLFVAKPVYKATQSPVIDGKPDAFWANYPASGLNKVLIGTIANASYLSANWKATYDATNLYVLVTVTDQKLVNSNSAVYNDDGIEIYFDNGNTKTYSYNSNQFQYGFGWNDTKVNESIHNATTGVVFAQTNQGVVPGCTNNCTAQGYTMEVKIPWSTLGVTNPTPDIFEGFEVMVNDDNTGTRNAKIAWTATTDNAWQEPSLFGSIILKDMPCTASDVNIISENATTFCSGHAAELNTDFNSAAYQWYRSGDLIAGATNNTFNAFISGDYTVSIIDNNCVSSASPITISVDSTSTNTNAGADQYITSTQTALAGNQPFVNTTGIWTLVNGSASITDPSLYNTTVTGLSSGINTFTWLVTSDTCGSSQDDVVIHVGSAPTPSAITGSATININNPSAVYSFIPSDNTDNIHWTVPTGAIIESSNPDSTQITVNIGSSIAGGVISVTEKNLFGSSQQRISYDVTTAIRNSVSGISYTVMPNPFYTNSVIVVNSTNSDPVTITITDMTGITVSTYNKESGNASISIGENLSAGIYLVRIQQGLEYSILKLIKM
jgi:endoglucanase